MPKFKAYVKVPADSTGSLKRIVTKTIDAKNSVDALATLRGKYGTGSVNITQQVNTASKPRAHNSSSKNSHIPKSPPFVKKIYRYKYAKSAPKPMTNKEAVEDLSALAVGIYKTINFLLKVFNIVTREIMFAFFGKHKVYYWSVNNKHALAFSLSSINMMMLYLLYESIMIYFY